MDSLTRPRVLSLGETDQKIVAQHKAQLAQVLDYYEKILEKQDYLAGQVGNPQSRCLTSILTRRLTELQLGGPFPYSLDWLHQRPSPAPRPD
jgi:glutathione S-transferase